MILLEHYKAYNEDVIISKSEFEIIIMGKGSYYGDLHLHSSIQKDFNNVSHLIYIGRYCSIGGDVNIIVDLSHSKNSVYQGCIPIFKGNEDNLFSQTG